MNIYQRNIKNCIEHKLTKLALHSDLDDPEDIFRHYELYLKQLTYLTLDWSEHYSKLMFRAYLNTVKTFEGDIYVQK